MSIKKNSVSAGGVTTLYLVVLNGVILETAYTSNSSWYWALIVTLPLLLFSLIFNLRNSIPDAALFESMRNGLEGDKNTDSMGAMVHQRRSRPQGVKTKMAAQESI